MADRACVERYETAVVQAAPDDAGDSAQGASPGYPGGLLLTPMPLAI